MPRLEIPLESRKMISTGDIVLHAVLELEVKSNQGTWKRFRCVVDSGTEMTTMPASEARDQDLPIPKRPVRLLVFRAHEVRRGLLRARIVGLDATEYVFPCYFLGDPDVPIDDPKNLLGLTGVIDYVRLIFDGTRSPSALDGPLIVEKI